jgi:hypothetical protein
MADRVVVFADQDFADDEPRDALPLVEADLVVVPEDVVHPGLPGG